MTDKQKRYVGLDVHKYYMMVRAVNRFQKMVLAPRKVSLAEFEGWAKKNLKSIFSGGPTCGMQKMN